MIRTKAVRYMTDESYFVVKYRRHWYSPWLTLTCACTWFSSPSLNTRSHPVFRQSAEDARKLAADMSCLDSLNAFIAGEDKKWAEYVERLRADRKRRSDEDRSLCRPNVELRGGLTAETNNGEQNNG